MGTRVRRFHWLKPGTLNTFKVRAVSGLAQSDDAEIEIMTSGFVGMTWPNGARLKAKPVFWNRTIVVKWTLMNEPLRMDYYRLFRKETTIPSPAELADNSKESGHYVKDTGRFNYHTDHLVGSKGLNVDWGYEVEKNKTYYYWVWAFDKGGLPSATYLGYDSATFGPPATPTLNDAYYSTQVHDRMKWLCDFTIAWGGQAEYYLAQRKLSALPFWGPLHYVEHDSDAGYQSHTFENLICGKEYDFRVKAVNVPIVLVSGWGTDSAITGEDQVRPDEIQNVVARRFYVNLWAKGDHIRIAWDRPALAIIEQQLEYFRLYRYKGLDAGAIIQQGKINISQYASDSRKPAPYAEIARFGGTHFIDDEIVATKKSTGGTEEQWDFTWNCEGANDTERSTAQTGGGALVGTLAGDYAFKTAAPYEGTYNFSYNTNGGSCSWYTGGVFTFSADEGFLEYYFKGNWDDVPGAVYAFEFYYNPWNYIRCWYGDTFPTYAYKVQRRGAATIHEVEVPTAAFSGASDPKTYWVRIQVRWSVSGNKLGTRVNDGAWYEADTSTPLEPFDSSPTYLSFAAKACVNNNVDMVSLSLYYNVPMQSLDEAYHYWVTAVDAVGLESLVTGPNDSPNESYAKVTFGIPDKPTNLDAEYNTTLNLLSVKLMTMKITWDPVDEATHHRVAVRSKPKGRSDYCKWHISPLLNEARLDDPDTGKKYHVYPFPLLQNTEVHYKVSSWNASGESNWEEVKEKVGVDTTPPTAIQNLWGRCFGIYSLLFQKLWIGVKLTWDDLEPYEGVKLYQVQIYNTLTSSWDFATNAHPTIGKKKVVAWDPGPPIANSHRYRVRAVSWDAISEDDANGVGPWAEIKINWLQWWKLASN